MSALLDDIIKTATDGNRSLSELLRKCLLLAHDLKNPSLKQWANQELSGYAETTNVPEYRHADAAAKGHFVGAFHSELKNYPIPSIGLKEEHRHWARDVYLTQAVCAYEHVAKLPEGTVTFPWPADLVALYQRTFFQGKYVLVHAYQEVANSVVIELLDSVRNRTLNMALEIKDELGTSYVDLHSIAPMAADRIENIVFQHIEGGTNYFATGHAHLDASSQTVVSVGDWQALESLLGKVGLDKSDVSTLGKAIESDGGQNPGSKVGAWVKEHGSKVLTGGVKIGAKIGQELLVAWLKQYYGIS